MANLNKTKLDAVQCVVGAYDGVEEANRVIIAAATEFAVELSAADGDSIISFTAVSDSVTSIPQTPGMAANTVLLTIADVSKYSKLQVYSEALAGVSVAGTVSVQVSPEASGSFWATLGSAISSPSAPGTGVSSVVDFVAKRARIVSNVAPTGGNVEYKVILKS
jgi:hypothetical protein